MGKKNFKELYARLEEIVDLLEKNDNIKYDLDQSLKLFEEGLQIISECDQELNNFDEKINFLIREYEEQKSA